MDEPFARLLRRFRVRAGLTISELAEATGAAHSSIRAWEQGRRVPRDRARLADLAQVLQLSSTEATTLAAAARSHRDPGVVLAPQIETEAEAAASSTVTGVPLTTHHLRAPIGDFVGREQEIAALQDTLMQALQSGAAICGVQGMGGIGKTELAYRVAHELRAAFPDAQIVIELRGASPTPLTPAQALQTVIRAFMPDANLLDDLTDLQQRYRSLLHQRHVLLLADDARDAAQVRPLLPPAGSALLLTSRSRFSLPGMTTLDLEHLSEEEAIRLLGTICPRLAPPEAEWLASACGYLPLALRVCGSLLHNDQTLSASDYLARLADEGRRLSALRDPDDPQLDVAATLALSYDLLDQTVQAVFRQLGVFAADFSTELAQTVVRVNAGESVTDLLRYLLRRNLVSYDLVHERWLLHDLLRDLARTYLENVGETAAVMWRYTRAAIQLAQTIQDHYLAGGDTALGALARFDCERPHIGASQRWATAQAATSPGDTLLVAAALATRQIGLLRADLRHEQLPLLEQAFQAAQRVGDTTSASILLNNVGLAYASLGEARRAHAVFTQRLHLAQAHGDRRAEGAAYNNRGMAALFIGDMSQALPDLTQALTIAQALGDRRGESAVLNNLGDAYVALGELEQAQRTYTQDLIISQELGDRRKQGNALSALGLVALRQGAITQALVLCTQAQTLAQEVGDQRLEGYVLNTLAQIYAAQNDAARALPAFEQALAYLDSVGDRRGAAECRWQFGLLLAQQEHYMQALPLLRAALAYQEEIGHIQARAQATLLADIETRTTDALALGTAPEAERARDHLTDP